MFEQPLTLSSMYPGFNALPSFPHPQRDRGGKEGGGRETATSNARYFLHQ